MHGKMRMTTSTKHSWNPPSWLKEPTPKEVIYHDVKLEAYLGKVSIKDIHLWRNNNRTLLDIAHIEKELKIKYPGLLTDDQIINFIIRQGLHNLPDLAKSIKENGVRVPLVLTFEKELLDGNRRF